MLQEFPEVIYKGNSINSTFKIMQKDTEYTFREGDIVIFGIKSYVGTKKYLYMKKIETTPGEKIIDIKINPDETRNIMSGGAVLELTLINGNFEKTLYQEKIEIKEVVNNERV